jgi:hypothetical protein
VYCIASIENNTAKKEKSQRKAKERGSAEVNIYFFKFLCLSKKER